MPSLTITEKEHWKDRIGRKIDKKIEAVEAGDPGYMDRVEERARQRAVQSLGLTEKQAALDALEAQEKELEKRQEHLQKAMLAAVRRVPIEEIQSNSYYNLDQEVNQAIHKRQVIHEEELLAEDELGRQILGLRQEKDNLLDTVWLATSPLQIKELWQKVTTLLGEEQTLLQKEALALAAMEPA